MTPILKQILGYILIFFVALLLTEGGLQVLGYPKNLAEQYANLKIYTWSLEDSQGSLLSKDPGEVRLELDPLLLYHNKPNVVGSRYSTNSRGFRGKEVTPNPREGVRRIFILGGLPLLAQEPPITITLFQPKFRSLLKEAKL